MNPQTVVSRRLAQLFARPAQYHWSYEEVSRYYELDKQGFFENGNLALLERYYASERRKGKDGIHRRDLTSFLNNFGPELDRARMWSKPPKRNATTRSSEVRPSDEEWERIAQKAREELERFKRDFK
jgi:hypothetical protein